ncbi:hypothetical protein ACFWDI_26480 [Streptomyces sp. NPDC060064]|uniref:hypothetical protein n=1 Tax=Streptomyces sp. NPDC060064 TaxID=3347049 RepID=UPI00369CB518
MHDNAGIPEPDHSETSPAGDERQSIDHDAALEKVRAVAGWYRQAIFQERQSGAPDSARLEQLMAALQKSVADQRAREDAGPEEAARIAAEYEALYTELMGE